MGDIKGTESVISSDPSSMPGCQYPIYSGNP